MRLFCSNLSKKCRKGIPHISLLCTSYHPETKNLANWKHKKGHNSGKIVEKSSLSNLTKIFIRYTYIPHLASIRLFVHNLLSITQFGWTIPITIVLLWRSIEGQQVLLCSPDLYFSFKLNKLSIYRITFWKNNLIFLKKNNKFVL